MTDQLPPAHMFSCGLEEDLTIIDLSNKDSCNLFRAVAQSKTDLAIAWLERWYDRKEGLSRTDQQVLAKDCIHTNNYRLLSYLLRRGIITHELVENLTIVPSP